MNTNNQTNEEIVLVGDMPVYYSKKAIVVFSALFSTLFGAILLAINIRKTVYKNKIWGVIGFGIVYAVLLAWALSFLPNDTTVLTIVLSSAGGYLMNYIFWRKYLGENVLYIRKPVWIPAAIGIAIVTLFVLVIVLANVN